MLILREMRRRARYILPAAFCAVVVGYFTSDSYLKINREVRDAQDHLKKMQFVRLELEQRVKGLRDTSLDLDLLEERARIVLNLMRDDELLIHFPKN